MFPFGFKVYTMPSPIAKNGPHKMGPVGVTWIILGFQILPPGLSHYKYTVAAINDFAEINLHRNAPGTDFHARIHRVREAYHLEADDFEFPLKARNDHDNITLEGVTQRLAPDSAAHACPPIFDGSNVGGGALRPTRPDDGEPFGVLMLTDDIANHTLGDTAEIPDNDGDDGDIHDDGENYGHEPLLQQDHDVDTTKPETDDGVNVGQEPAATTKPEANTKTLYRRAFAGDDKFGYPSDEFGFRIGGIQHGLLEWSGTSWALLDPTAKADELTEGKY